MRLKLGHLNLFVIFSLILFNTTTLVLEGKDLKYYFLYVIPFIVVLLGYYFLSRKYSDFKVNAWVYLFCGVITTIMGQVGNATGVIFFCFSIFMFGTTRINIWILGLALFSIVVKFLILGFSVVQAFSILLMYSYVLTVYYLLIHPKKKEMLTTTYFDDSTRIILEYLVNGFKYKEISTKKNVYISADAIRQRINTVRKSFSCTNNEQLIFKLSEKGYFHHNCD